MFIKMSNWIIFKRPYNIGAYSNLKSITHEKIDFAFSCADII